MLINVNYGFPMLKFYRNSENPMQIHESMFISKISLKFCILDSNNQIMDGFGIVS